MTTTQSAGVSELIERLQQEGVSQGQAQAQQLLDEARQQATQILTSARQEAETLKDHARHEAEQLRRAGTEALQLALRDAVLSLKTQLSERFRERVRRLVSATLNDPEFLQRLILEVARQPLPPADAGQTLEVLLPDTKIDLQQLRSNPEAIADGSLAKFVLTLASDQLREGITFNTHDKNRPGIAVRIVEQEVELDLTDQAISQLLLDHLMPRFRAVFEGIVH